MSRSRRLLRATPVFWERSGRARTTTRQAKQALRRALVLVLAQVLWRFEVSSARVRVARCRRQPSFLK
jgi:hypothetical protein